jgi:hypothetical protein
MKLLIIPGIPFLAIYLAHFFATHLKLIPALVLTGIIIFTIALIGFRHLYRQLP